MTKPLTCRNEVDMLSHYAQSSVTWHTCTTM